jgi:hypothetical protein
MVEQIELCSMCGIDKISGMGWSLTFETKNYRSNWKELMGCYVKISHGDVRGEPNATDTPAAAADARIYRFWADKILNKAWIIIESDTDLRSDGATWTSLRVKKQGNSWRARAVPGITDKRLIGAWYSHEGCSLLCRVKDLMRLKVQGRGIWLRVSMDREIHWEHSHLVSIVDLARLGVNWDRDKQLWFRELDKSH